jgi:predicted ATPase/DNA-binding CsgD family transcriptional regulator
MVANDTVEQPERASILPAGTMTFLAGEEGIAAFTSAADALAVAVKRGSGALHTGEARRRDDGRYVGTTVRRCERLREIANDGQTLLSSLTASLVADALPAGWSLHDLGMHRLRDLSHPERVFELRADGVAEAPPLRSLDAYPNNLPLQLTSFVGRRAELDAVHRLLTGERLVTLTGAGGSGKTRLAAQVAAEQADRWPDGVWWVELVSAGDGAQVAELVAAAVGVLVEPVQGARRSLLAQLPGRRMLVCLDNCEHVLDGAADVADAVLRTCPESSLLTTSREPLGIPGEAVWRIPSLSEDEALSLFVERGSQVRPWFSLDPANESAVRTMCARLDGIPLALELAAAWLGTLTPAQIEAGLDDRFALLVRGPRGVPARQQTLAASIAWSHDLLDEPDRVVFRRLAAFSGGFTLDAARAACGNGAEVLEALGRLVDKSLVVAGDARFRMLETIREYAGERLREAGEEASTRDRHLDHYLAVVEASEPELDRDKDAWRARLEAEHDNLRAALDWGLSADDPERGRRLASGLPWLWHLHGHGPEGIEFLQRAIRRAPDDRSVLQARLLTGVALVADTAGPLDIEYDVAQRALELATEHGDERLRRLCLALSAVGQFYTDFDAAWELACENLDAAEAAGDGFVVDATRALQGIILHLRDRHDEARPLLESAAAGLLGRGDRGVAATVVGFQAAGALYTGEPARELAERAVEIAEPLGDYHRVGTARSTLALVLGAGGDVGAGLRVMEPVLRLLERADAFVPGMARVLGTLHLWRGDLEDAVRWLERESRSTDRGADTYLAAQALPPLGAALRLLGRDDEAAGVLDRAVAVARTLGMPRVEADALEQQAHLAADPDLHHEALALRVEHGLRGSYAGSLDALAALTGRPDPEMRARMTLEEAVAYVRRARGTRARPPGGWASLTPTELDVVRLAVEGLNNPEIGKRLFMSRSTVKTHLSHVYAKLGVANRTELAALASRQRFEH